MAGKIGSLPLFCLSRVQRNLIKQRAISRQADLSHNQRFHYLLLQVWGNLQGEGTWSWWRVILHARYQVEVSWCRRFKVSLCILRILPVYMPCSSVEIGGGRGHIHRFWKNDKCRSTKYFIFGIIIYRISLQSTVCYSFRYGCILDQAVKSRPHIDISCLRDANS